MIKNFNVGMIDAIMTLWLEQQNENHMPLEKVMQQYEVAMKAYVESDALVVYEAEGKVIAYLSLSPVMEITNLYVAPNYRHQQIATKLIDTCVMKFKQLHVLVDNRDQEMIHFFSLNGFAIAQLREKNHHSHLVMVSYQENKH